MIPITKTTQKGGDSHGRTEAAADLVLLDLETG